MLRVFLTIASVFGACFAAAQDAPAKLALSTSRLNDVALRWAAPEELPEGIARELEQVFLALDKKQGDETLRHWREFLRRRDQAPLAFDPGVYVDVLLHRIATARNDDVRAASDQLRFYDAQEAAVLEHMTTVDKQISIYAGEDKPQVPLREPQLADYADGAEAVTLAPAETVGVDKLVASLKYWRERAPAISEARETAQSEFVNAVAADDALGEELRGIDTRLRGEIKEIVVREVKP